MAGARSGLTPHELTGLARGHVVELADPPCTLHRDAVAPFLAMRRAAARAGIDLVPASSFRDFARQRSIWNAKFEGARPVLDAAGSPLEVAELEPRARVEAILVWSALPGASRHHWGTDLDLVDRNALPAGYQPQLVPREYGPDGVFAALSAWLDANLRRYGFYRPYASDRGGVRPEPWHVSYAPVARRALRELTPAVLAEAIAGRGVAGETAVLQLLPAIHARYVRAVDAPPRMRSRWARLAH